MARAGTPKSPLFPYHLTSRCINRESFPIPIQEVWRIMSEYLWFIHYAFNIKILAFLLMRNHYHMLAIAPDQNFAEAMNYFLRETSRQIGFEADRINQTYGGRYFRSQIETHHYYLNAYKYLYRNPVEAGVCHRVEDYPFSTLHGLLGQSQILIPIEYDHTLFSDVAGTLYWLNTSPQDEHREAMRRALKRRIFKLPINKSTGRASALEQILY